MQRKKILWLVSWYPHQHDPFDGDFIQRHARAAAIYHDIHVVFVTTDEEKNGTELLTPSTGLTEEIIYLEKKKGYWGRLRQQWQWQREGRRAIDRYIRAQGRPQGIHVHVAWKAGLWALWAKKKYGLPYLVSEHWGMYAENNPDAFVSKPVIQRTLTRELFQKAGALVTVSRYLSKTLEMAVGRAADRILPNVVDTTLFYPKEEKYSRFTFLHVSNMAPVKNVHGILEAFAGFVKEGGEAQLLVIGNRDDRYVQMAASLGVLNSGIFFLGEVPYSGVAEEMRRAHCLVLFSHSETFSCVTAEALCTGLPVICPQVGALPELVNGSNGILIPPGDKKALGAAFREMVEHSGRFSGQKTSDEASRTFGYPALAEGFRQLYNDFFR